ncbi:MAG: hypothetical protein R3B54_16080 [Bdellovibrionota bacterium]
MPNSTFTAARLKKRSQRSKKSSQVPCDSGRFDTFEEDPVGHCKLRVEDYAEMGRALAELQLPTLICQEGGYNLEALEVREYFGRFLVTGESSIFHREMGKFKIQTSYCY